MERKYVAFISYRHAELDSAVAKQLHTLIEQYVIPKYLRKDGKKKLGIVFRDQEELPISSNLSDDICRALDNSQYLIVVCSKSTAQSPWVGREISYFLSHHDQEHTLAVLASGEPVDVFPRALTQRTLRDGTVEEVEPLAVDVRAKDIPGMKKKLKQEIKRLYAALIGCPYDALVMREQRRKRRQLATVMGLILAVVTSFAGVMLVKNYEIDLKNQELAGMNQTLEDKNDELARQKAQVQLRESQLLTEKGVTALSQSDVQSALENFLSALPGKQEDRPYYAPAEQGLMSALEIFQTEPAQYLPVGTTLEQKTPIAAYEISPDGTKLLTMDAYSRATCFDIASGSVLWSFNVTEQNGARNQQIISYPENGTVILNAGSGVKGVSWDAGEILWQHESRAMERLYLSPDRKVLAYRGTSYSEDFTTQTNQVVLLDAATGEMTGGISFGESAVWPDDTDGKAWWQFPDVENTYICAMAFSPDSRLLALQYQEQQDDGTTQERYVVIDLATQAARLVFSRQQEQYASDTLVQLFFLDNNADLLILRTGEESRIALHLTKISLETGQILWDQQAPEVPEEDAFSSKDPVFAAAGDSMAFLTRGPYLFLLDCRNGTWISARERSADIVSMEIVNGSTFSLIQADGGYTLGWMNSGGAVCADSYFNVPIALSGASSARLWQGGALKLVIEDGRVKNQIGGDPAEGYGFVALIPQDNDHCVRIQHLEPVGALTDAQAIEPLPEHTTLVGGRVMRLRDNRLVYGQASDSEVYSLFLLDQKTGKQEQIVLGDYISIDYVAFPSDGKGYLTMDPTEDLLYHGLDGTVRSLMKNEYLSYPNDSSLGYYRNLYGSAPQKDGKLLTVSQEEKLLTYWKDGKDPVTVQIPEDITAQVLETRFLLVGENGYILLVNWENTQNGAAYRDLAAYCVENGQWYRFAADRVTGPDYIGLASEHPWAAIVDADTNVYICDIATDSVVCQFPTQLTFNAVRSLKLVNKDRHLLITTNDKQLFLYDVETGKLLYSQQTDHSVMGQICAAVDEKNQRMYLWNDDSARSAGLCLDMGSWTLLAEIPQMLYYDAQENLLYFTRKLTGTYGTLGLHAMHVPSTRELIEISQSLLE